MIVAYHALGDTFPIGTLRAMLADAGWDDDDLGRLGLVKWSDAKYSRVFKSVCFFFAQVILSFSAFSTG